MSSFWNVKVVAVVAVAVVIKSFWLRFIDDDEVLLSS
jgi:hypothetical protein